MMKKARKLLGIFLIVAGICMIAYSAWFLIRYRANTADMAADAEEILKELNRVIPDEPVMTEPPIYEDADSMPSLEIKEVSCIGKLWIPRLELELPVANASSDIGFTPIHVSGTPNTTDFVIEALGYSSQFGNLTKLELKDSIIFVDLYGYRYSYEITGIVSGTAEQLQSMDDAMMESDVSSVSAPQEEVEEEPAADTGTQTVQHLPGFETVTGEGNETAQAQTEKRRPELVLKFRKSLRTYVRVAGIYRSEENEDDAKAAG